MRDQRDWLDTIAMIAAGVSEGQFRADVDPRQFAQDLEGVMLAYHLTSRLLDDPERGARPGTPSTRCCDARAAAGNPAAEVQSRRQEKKYDRSYCWAGGHPLAPPDEIGPMIDAVFDGLSRAVGTSASTPRCPDVEPLRRRLVELDGRRGTPLVAEIVDPAGRSRSASSGSPTWRRIGGRAVACRRQLHRRGIGRALRAAARDGRRPSATGSYTGWYCPRTWQCGG